jgi:uncharacterized protein DUF3551
MIRYALATLVLALPLSGEATAQADPYRWCADYAYGGLSGAKNCYFLTLEQCRATVSGVGGTCVPNPFYTGPVNEWQQPVRPRRR